MKAGRPRTNEVKNQVSLRLRARVWEQAPSRGWNLVIDQLQKPTWDRTWQVGLILETLA